MFRFPFRAIAVGRRQLSFVLPAAALMLGGCQKLKDKVSNTLYTYDAPNDGPWKRDSALIASRPPVLYRVLKLKSDEYLFPIAELRKGAPVPLRFTKRGWAMFDLETFYEGKEVTPIVNNAPASPVKMLQGMWQIASAPLDSTPARLCPSLVAIGKVSLPAGANVVVSNYKIPANMKTLSEGELAAAVSQVPTLVTPTMGVKPSVLADYKRTLRQIPRAGGEPGVYVQYDDFREVNDTSAIAQRLPRHIVIVLEKGVYGYRPSWTYSTSGRPGDRPILRFLEAMDLDGDGKGEILFAVDVANGMSYTIVFRQYNDTWKEFWRRSPSRCDA